MLKSKISKIILFLIIPILIAGVSFFYNFAGMMFSAGPVTRGHIEYQESCFKCHAVFSSMTNACLDCHEKLEKRIDKELGFHGTMSKDDRKNCMQCHTDHKGHDFFIVNDVRSKDDLLRLVNKVAEKEKPVVKDFPIEVKDEYLNLWKSLPKKYDWKQIEKKLQKEFDHTLTGYPLIGKHKKAKCKECHGSVKDFKPTDKKGLLPGFTISDLDNKNFCYSCHKKTDKGKKGHKGKYGKDCSKCHTVGGGKTGWKATRSKIRNHHKAKDKLLEGKHKKVKCRKCHVKVPFKKKKEDQKCIACHKEHDKKIHEKSLGKECKDCHTPIDFRKSKFDHQKTDFILYHTHKKVKCQKCHSKWDERKKKKKIYKKIIDSRCYTCHTADDVHRGAFKSNCARCHKETYWADVIER